MQGRQTRNAQKCVDTGLLLCSMLDFVPNPSALGSRHQMSSWMYKRIPAITAHTIISVPGMLVLTTSRNSNACQRSDEDFLFLARHTGLSQLSGMLGSEEVIKQRLNFGGRVFFLRAAASSEMLRSMSRKYCAVWLRSGEEVRLDQLAQQSPAIPRVLPPERQRDPACGYSNNRGQQQGKIGGENYSPSTDRSQPQRLR